MIDILVDFEFIVQFYRRICASINKYETYQILYLHIGYNWHNNYWVLYENSGRGSIEISITFITPCYVSNYKQAQIISQFRFDITLLKPWNSCLDILICFSYKISNSCLALHLLEFFTQPTFRLFQINRYVFYEHWCWILRCKAIATIFYNLCYYHTNIYKTHTFMYHHSITTFNPRIWHRDRLNWI